MSQTYLARTSLRSTADERHETGAMVRRPERTFPHQAAEPASATGDGINFSGFNGLGARHGRQNGGQTRRHQAFAAPGAADQNQIMPARSGNLQSSFGLLLPADLFEIVTRRLIHIGFQRTMDEQMTAVHPLGKDIDGFAQR